MSIVFRTFKKKKLFSSQCAFKCSTHEYESFWLGKATTQKLNKTKDVNDKTFYWICSISPICGLIDAIYIKKIFFFISILNECKLSFVDICQSRMHWCMVRVSRLQPNFISSVLSVFSFVRYNICSLLHIVNISWNWNSVKIERDQRQWLRNIRKLYTLYHLFWFFFFLFLFVRPVFLSLLRISTFRLANVRKVFIFSFASQDELYAHRNSVLLTNFMYLFTRFLEFTNFQDFVVGQTQYHLIFFISQKQNQKKKKNFSIPKDKKRFKRLAEIEQFCIKIFFWSSKSI